MLRERTTVTMTSKDEPTSVFDQIKAGLADSAAFSRGELSLETTELPAPPPQQAPGQIAALRKSLQMSQAVFAATLNVSKKTLQSWEQGLRKPSDASLRMLQVIHIEPGVVQKVFSVKTGTKKTRIAAKRGRGTSSGRVAAKRKAAPVPGKPKR